MRIFRVVQNVFYKKKHEFKKHELKIVVFIENPQTNCSLDDNDCTEYPKIIGSFTTDEYAEISPENNLLSETDKFESISNADTFFTFSEFSSADQISLSSK